MITFCYIVLYVVIFLVGIVIGSFLNVCIYRLPKGESIVKVRSHCMTCGAQIQNRDLIPILSWCLLKGRCRNCGAKISPRYTVVEALNGVLYVLIFLYYGVMDNPLQAALVCLLFSALIVVFFMDLDTQLVNMYVVGFIGLDAIAYTLCDWLLWDGSWLSHLLGAVVAFVPLMLIVLLSHERAMGSGDAWLMLPCGLFLGLKSAIVGLLLGLILGCIFGLIHKARTGDSKFAFAPYLSLGVALAVFIGEPIADWYLAVCGF